MTYKEFIDNILSTRGRFACGEEYHERHHIQPKCLGGGNEEDNLIDLYAQEHYEAHKLLFEENRSNQSLAFAWWRLSTRNGVSVSAEEYADLRSVLHHTDEAKKKIGEASKGNHNTRGKLWYNNGVEQILLNSNDEVPDGYVRGFLDDVKQKISQASIGKTISDEQCKAHSLAIKGRHFFNNGEVQVSAFDCPDGFVEGQLPKNHEHIVELGKATKGRVVTEETREKLRRSATGKHPSAETRAKMSAANKGHHRNAGKKWWNNGIEQTHSKVCPDGWVAGRLPTGIKTKGSAGMKWFTNGFTQVLAYECPDGFTAGRLKKEAV